MGVRTQTCTLNLCLGTRTGFCEQGAHGGRRVRGKEGCGPASASGRSLWQKEQSKEAVGRKIS